MKKDWYKKVWTMDIQNMSWVEDTKKEVDFLIDQLKLQGNERVMFIDSMGVDEHYRGQGIGRELFAFARNICEEQDYDGLELQVNAKNIAAKRMYEKYGFTEKSINMELLNWRE